MIPAYKNTVLFQNEEIPYGLSHIRFCVEKLGKGYNRTVAKVIANSTGGIDKKVFYKNVGILMPNFLMGRSGPFKGIKYSDGRLIDPNGTVSDCWDCIGEKVVGIRVFIDHRNRGKRSRALLTLSDADKRKLAKDLWGAFKKILPVCMGKQTLGLVGASKILFAALPEVALPVDNAEWRHVFKTVDFGDVILRMASEIEQWEHETRLHLEECDPTGTLTLPGVYNVMAMAARP